MRRGHAVLTERGICHDHTSPTVFGRAKFVQNSADEARQLVLKERKNPDFSGFELEPTSGFEPLTC
jgi:hypothetical protein